MVSEWFYQADGQHFGPIVSAELRRLADTGIVTPNTLVRKGADGSWGYLARKSRAFSISALAFVLNPATAATTSAGTTAAAAGLSSESNIAGRCNLPRETADTRGDRLGVFCKVHAGTPCLRSHNGSLGWCFWEESRRTHTSPDLLRRSESSVEEDNWESAMAI